MIDGVPLFCTANEAVFKIFDANELCGNIYSITIQNVTLDILPVIGELESGANVVAVAEEII